MPRTESEITADLAAQRQAYHEAAAKLPAPQLKPLQDKIKATMAELSALIAAGAVLCPKCGNPPHGMLKKREKDVETYEVGCLHCPDEKYDKGNVTIASSARGGSPERAVAKWNESGWVKKHAAAKKAAV